MAYQSTHTGAQVDEAVDNALSADAVPTPGSTNLVQSGGVFGVVSNRNLLDNPFFGSGEVVNQRGVTSGTTTNATYFIDRWLTTYGSAVGTYSLGNNGITLTPASGSTVTMYQKLANESVIDGKAVTASVLLSDGTIYSGTITRANGTTQNYYNANGIRIRQVTDNGFHIDVSLNGGVTIRAVKLELGSVSTLANDAPPNFAEELAKCQRYFVRVPIVINRPYASGVATSAAGTQIRAVLPLPATMRTNPTATLTGTSMKAVGNAQSLAVSAVAADSIAPGGAILLLTVSGAVQNQCYNLVGNGDTTLDLSADL